VVLLGARQVGKTTLAKTIANDLNSIYLDLEAPQDLFISLRGLMQKLSIIR
jgi:hypothetical protein